MACANDTFTSVLKASSSKTLTTTALRRRSMPEIRLKPVVISIDSSRCREVEECGIGRVKNCHCIACCSCSPRDRLSGVCPAFTFSHLLLAASLETGLDLKEEDWERLERSRRCHLRPKSSTVRSIHGSSQSPCSIQSASQSGHSIQQLHLYASLDSEEFLHPTKPCDRVSHFSDTLHPIGGITLQDVSTQAMESASVSPFCSDVTRPVIAPSNVTLPVITVKPAVTVVVQNSFATSKLTSLNDQGPVVDEKTLTLEINKKSGVVSINDESVNAIGYNDVVAIVPGDNEITQDEDTCRNALARNKTGDLAAAARRQAAVHRNADASEGAARGDAALGRAAADEVELKLRDGESVAAVNIACSVGTTVNRTSGAFVSPTEFKQRLDTIWCWFSEFNDRQKTTVLKELLVGCGPHQIHTLSVEMSPRMHRGCPPNCEDWLSWLPTSISLQILSFLDPVSLCRCSYVSRRWNELSSDSLLWRQLCSLTKWRLSPASEQKQLVKTSAVLETGQINWKMIFSDRYRLKTNWLRGRCNVRTFEGHTQGVSCIQFDETRIVSGSSDKTIKLWNMRTNSPWAVQTLVGHSGTVRCLHLNGNRLVSGSTDKTIKVWDVSSQQNWTSIACRVTMIGHTDTVRCLKVDDEKVISGSYDKTLKVWDIRTGLCLQTLRGHGAAVLCVQFDNNKILSGSCDKTIKVWTFDGACVMTLEGHHDAVTCLQFDDTRIISGSIDCTLRLWDVRTGLVVKVIDWKESEGHTGVIRCLQADTWRVVSASDDRTIKVWNIETGQRLVTLRNHTDGVTCLQFNDNIIVSGSYDKTVKLWDFSSC